jgi:pimeloyl-ACP methyl ester carboxylesterase
MTDNVRVRQRLLQEVFGIERVRLVYGFSMGAQQAFHWGALFPTGSSASPRSAARRNVAASAWQDSWFATPPTRGFQAMGRVYAGWGLSQAFSTLLSRTTAARSHAERRIAADPVDLGPPRRQPGVQPGRRQIHRRRGEGTAGRVSAGLTRSAAPPMALIPMEIASPGIPDAGRDIRARRLRGSLCSLLRIGYFGASTGAAAALMAAGECPEIVRAVVSRGGRPDLAGPALARVEAPALLIVGGADPIGNRAKPVGD